MINFVFKFKLWPYKIKYNYYSIRKNWYIYKSNYISYNHIKYFFNQRNIIGMIETMNEVLEQEKQYIISIIGEQNI